MILKIKYFATLLLLVGCSSVEFIPEPEYTAYNQNYRIKSWQDVEVTRQRPSKAFLILGEVVIRNQADQAWESIESSLKKEMWERKMDGAWLVEKKHQKVDGFSLETTDNRGHTTSSYNDENNMRVWRGYAFRYK
jgi:uncharacterized protein YceK